MFLIVLRVAELVKCFDVLRTSCGDNYFARRVAILQRVLEAHRRRTKFDVVLTSEFDLQVEQTSHARLPRGFLVSTHGLHEQQSDYRRINARASARTGWCPRCASSVLVALPVHYTRSVRTHERSFETGCLAAPVSGFDLA